MKLVAGVRCQVVGVFTLLAFLVPGGPLGAQALDGVWRSEGYGNVFVIRGDTLRAYEVTQATCLSSFTAQRTETARPGFDAVFRVQGQSQVFLVRAGDEPDRRRFHSDGAASDMVFQRIEGRPAVCERPVPNTPTGNFEVFTRTWAEHYILFDQKRLDWPAVVARARARITPGTTPRQLFELFRGMIEPLHDAHTNLSAPSLHARFFGFRPEGERFLRGGLEHFLQVEIPRLTGVTERAHLRGPLRKWCNDQVQYGRLADSLGYLRILSFSGYAKDGTFSSGLAALEAALDTIFTDAAGVRGLVIDVRVNLGGADPYGLAIAARLATQEYLAYSKEARADPEDRQRWTPGQPSLVRPSARPGFRGRVVELIGPLTISAGETFTQALMGRTPQVVRIGENTQGVFSDVLGRKLPNGWTFGLPNEVFRTSEGKTFDGPGIPPDVAVPVFPESELAAGRDGALEKALEMLGVREKGT